MSAFRSSLSWSKLGLLLLVLVGCHRRGGLESPPRLATPEAEVAPATAAPPRATPARINKRGLHLLLTDGRHQWPESLWPAHMAAAADILGPGGWVVQLVTLDDLDPVRWQRFLDLCAAEQLRPIIRLATRYDRAMGAWDAPPADPDGGYATVAGRYVAFLTALSWPGAERLVIVGNEPNHGDEWGGQADPAAYARFLLALARALHAADSAFRVLNAPLDPYAPYTGAVTLANGMTYQDAGSFLSAMAAAEPGVFQQLDAWASHSYPPGPFTAPPWEQAYRRDVLPGVEAPPLPDPPAGLRNRGINGYEWELWLLSRLGAPELPVFITETGWRHRESSDPAATDNAPVDLPDAATAARYLDLAWRGNRGRYPAWPEMGWTPWAVDDRVQAVVPFALNGDPGQWGHTNWLVLDAGGRIRGRYPLADVWAGP